MSIILKMVDHLLPVGTKNVAIVAVQALVYLLLLQFISIQGVKHPSKTTYIEPRPLVEICAWCMALGSKLFLTFSTVLHRLRTIWLTAALAPAIKYVYQP